LNGKKMRCGARSNVPLWAAALCVLAVACAGTTLTGKQQQHPVLIAAPMTLGEADPEPTDADAEQSASVAATAEVSPEPEPTLTDLPDPRPLAEREQWEYELAFADGQVHVKRVTLRVFDHPVVSARHVGRFAIELWIGRELIERVRFDFPLLGAEVPVAERQDIREAPRFEPGLHASRTVLVPNSKRAVRAQLVDRATGSTTPLPWPPDAPLDPIIPAAETASAQAGSAPIPE
jgi:hypothetical protein